MAKKAFIPGTTLDSILGSSQVANAFNVANKVYEAKIDPATFLDPSLVLALP
jgi:hypothetical protein